MALATCRAFPDLDPDHRGLVAALAHRGVEARPVVWDELAPWSVFALVVVRSTWDYVARRDQFVAWARSVPRLANEAAVIEWNTDKVYLSGLARAGLPVVDTVLVAPGDDPAPAFADLDPASGWVVVKPTISAGARDTARYRVGDPSGPAHAAALQRRGRTAMIQPYLSAVEAVGESALVYLGGRYSHSVRKAPMLGAATGQAPPPDRRRRFAKGAIVARTATDDELALADAVLAEVPGGDLLYARIDLLTDDRGRLAVLEVEVTEPSLFLAHADGATDRLAGAIAERLGAY